jgi:phage repressor protein C with HTH and peptisase S24 domain/DNA-binding transcriptional regulator YiaG
LRRDNRRLTAPKQTFVSNLVKTFVCFGLNYFCNPQNESNLSNIMSELDGNSAPPSDSGLASGLTDKSPHLGDRLRNVWSKSGLKQDEFATRLGVTTVTLQNYFKNIRLPSSDFIKQTCVEFSVSAEWILWGTGPMQRGNAEITPTEAQNSGIIPEDEPPYMSPEAAPSMGYSLIPKVQARLAAGTGSLETEGKIIGYYAFKTDFLRRKGRPKTMVLMDVTGDSMEPVLLDRDTVLIDESQDAIIAGGVYAVGIEQEVYVKYLDRIPGKLVLRSRNERYAPIEVDMNGQVSESVRIIGRVVWSCREYVR